MNIIDDIKEMGMYDLAGNCVYINNKEVWYRDFEIELPLRDFIRRVMKKHQLLEEEYNDDDIFDDVMLEWLADGYGTLEGVIACLYRSLWAMAEYRESLKEIKEIVKDN